MRTLELIVDGMNCPGCVRQATALLRDVPGIATVRADRRTGRIRIEGDLDDSAVLAALADTDFTVRLVRSADS